MKFRQPNQPPSPDQLRCLERQINEVLDLILSAVKCQNVQDLLSICLVSRQFYMLAVPQLYREIRLNLSRASHLRLLHRLERPGCAIPKMIRSLAFLNVETKHIDKLARIKHMVSSLGNLKELEWHGTFDLLVSVIEILHVRFPKTRLRVRTLEGTVEETTDIMQNLWSVLVHPATARMITHFDLVLGDSTILYDGFKEALVTMLSRNSAITHLQIVAKNVVEQSYSLLPRTAGFRGEVLPKLRELRLYVQDSPVFTDHELQYWCDQGGWGELTFLGLYHVHSFRTFIGRTPRLNELWLLPRNTNDINILQSSLDASEFEQPFGALRRLQVQLPLVDGIVTLNTRRVVPWCILKQLPPDQLKTLDISHPHSEIDDVLNVPLAQDIKDIRNICSDLEELQVDIVLPGNTGSWPCDVLCELAAFNKPLKLTLIIHMENLATTAPSRALLRASKYLLYSLYRIGRIVRKERERLCISWQTPFTVRCAHTTYNTGTTDVLAPVDLAYSFEIRKGILGAYTKLSWFRSDHSHDIDKMALEELEARKDEWFQNACLRHDGAGYKREFRRREEHRVLASMVEKGYKADITLYDYWMRSEGVERKS